MTASLWLAGILLGLPFVALVVYIYWRHRGAARPPGAISARQRGERADLVPAPPFSSPVPREALAAGVTMVLAVRL